MNCALCNSEVVKLKGSLEFNTRSLGNISVPNIKYSECSACGDQLLPPKQSDKVFEFISKEEQKLINMLPIGEFVSANEAAAILGVTKQAFSKHPKIKSGLIFLAIINKRKFYNRKSLELFKKNGNGKYLLKPNQKTARKFSLANSIKVDFPAVAEDSIRVKDQGPISAES
jgi:hypothetical protein